ncbi:ABHD17A [Symbiodinium pilosum]|uniref:ABHD17A protein n=1 Tax=Symbiodinium pilosum TaxID=2952 RepID=A0A812S720_SYMPI|nr:ABHD17A [Symbiodinium pilosum]
MGLSLAASFVFLPPDIKDEQTRQASDYLVWDEQPAKFPGGGVRRPFLWLPAPQDAKTQRTLIFFHGNAEDLLLIEPDLVQFAKALKCNFLAVEYPGYGLCTRSKGCEEISFEGVEDVALHALVYCVSVRGIPPEKVLLHGRSLGSGPVLRLAKRARDLMRWHIGGVVLQCPFISIRQVAADYVGLPGSYLIPSDCYNNLDALQELCHDALNTWVPILILHGELDKVIKPYHGRALLQKAVETGHPQVEGVFPPNASHNHWSLREDVVKPMQSFCQRHVAGWREQQADSYFGASFVAHRRWHLIEMLLMFRSCMQLGVLHVCSVLIANEGQHGNYKSQESRSRMEPQLAGQLAELLLLTQHGQFGLLANATLLAARRAVTASLKEGSSFFLEGVQRDSPPGLHLEKLSSAGAYDLGGTCLVIGVQHLLGAVLCLPEVTRNVSTDWSAALIRHAALLAAALGMTQVAAAVRRHLAEDGPKHMPISLVAFIVGLHAISIVNCVPMNLHYSGEYAYVLMVFGMHLSGFAANFLSPLAWTLDDSYLPHLPVLWLISTVDTAIAIIVRGWLDLKLLGMQFLALAIYSGHFSCGVSS